MIMKKIFMLTFSFVLLLGLTACSPPFLSRFGNDDSKTADKRFKAIIEALESNDNDTLKSMFSQKARDEADDLEDGIAYVMEFYQGKMIEYTAARDVETHKESNGRTKVIKGSYTVTTDKEIYKVFFIDQTVNTYMPEEIGLYMLQVIKNSDEDEQFDWGGEKTYCAGIYRPEE